MAIRSIAPPILVSLLRMLRRRLRPGREERGPEWEYVPEAWERPVGGWNVESVVQKYREKWPAFAAALSGTRPLAVNHEAGVIDIAAANDVQAHNLVMTFAYVVSLSAERRDAVSVLDWGGGTGHYYAFARALLPRLRLDYHVRDLPVFVSEGRRVLPSVTFHEDDTCLLHQFDLVVASSSLQYSEHWQETFASLARASARYLYITRLPLSEEAPSFVVLQRAEYHGYGTEYLGWVLNRDQFLESAAGADLRLVREFLVGYGHHVAGAPETPVAQRGFLFEKRVADGAR